MTPLSGVRLWDILARGNNNFDLVRLLAAAAVIVSHAFQIVHGTTAAEPLAANSVYTLAQHAVNVFFMLSGVLVAASLDRSPNIVSFAVARLLRIFPGLIVCVLLVSLVLGPLVTTLDVATYLTSTATLSYVFTTLSLTTALAPLPGVFEALPVGGRVNLPLWSLKYEVLCYAALTVMGIVGVWQRTILLWSSLTAFFAVYLLSEAGHTSVDEHIAFDQVLRFSLCFFLGVAAYRLRHHVGLSPVGALSAAVLLIVTRQTALEETVGYLAVGYLTLCLAALPAYRLRALCSRADLSYGLYIYGWPVAQTIILIAPGITPLTLALTSLATAAVLAATSWYAVERPALALKDYFGKSHRRPATPPLAATTHIAAQGLRHAPNRDKRVAAACSLLPPQLPIAEDDRLSNHPRLEARRRASEAPSG